MRESVFQVVVVVVVRPSLQLSTLYMHIILIQMVYTQSKPTVRTTPPRHPQTPGEYMLHTNQDQSYYCRYNFSS